MKMQRNAPQEEQNGLVPEHLKKGSRKSQDKSGGRIFVPGEGLEEILES